MAFNIHITRIGENTPSGESAKVNKNRLVNAKNQKPAPSLISVPADRLMNKYPVRIFELQPQD